MNNSRIKICNYLIKFRIICDLGCGDGKIQEYFDSHPSKNVKQVFSYDLISTKPFIIEADIANLNVAD